MDNEYNADLLNRAWTVLVEVCPEVMDMPEFKEGNEDISLVLEKVLKKYLIPEHKRL